MNKITTIICVILLCILVHYPAYSQEDLDLKKRSSISSTSSLNENETKVWGVIVGISEYKNLSIEKQLKWADNDARALSKYLLSRNSQSTHVDTFINKNAQKEIIHKRIYEVLMNKSKPGDFVILYFAGHGDVCTKMGDAYFMMHDVNTEQDYAIGRTIRLGDIKEYIDKATKRGVKVLFMTDACRSGIILTNEDNIKRTSLELQGNWVNAMKLTSCSSDQYSFESDSLKHGVFTYYLLKGLLGRADSEAPQDTITFGEISTFVKNNVKEFTKDSKNSKARQVPAFSHDNEYTNLFSINKDDSHLLQTFLINDEIEHLTPTLAQRSLDIFNLLPQNYQNLISEFNELLSKGRFFNYDQILFTDNISLEPSFNIKIGNEKDHQIFMNNCHAVSYNKNGEKIIAGGRDGIKIINSLNFKTVKEISESGTLCIKISPDGRQFVAGTWKNRLVIFDFIDNKVVKSFTAHNNDIRTICFSPDGKVLASAGDDLDISVWNAKTWKLLRKAGRPHQSRITSMTISHNNQKLYSTDKSGVLKMWDLDKLEFIQSTKHSSPINTLTFHPDGKHIIAGDEKGRLIVYNANNLTRIRKFNLNLINIQSVKVDNTGNYVFAVGKTREIKVVDLTKEEVIVFTKSLYLPRGGTCLSYNQEKNKLICSTYGGHLHELDVNIKTDYTLPPFAYDYYKELVDNSQIKIYKEKLKEDFYLSLMSYTQGIIDRFISGDIIQPTEKEIFKALKNIKLAKEVIGNEELFIKKLNSYELFLETYQVIVTNNISQYDKVVRMMNTLIELEPEAAYTHNILSIIYKKIHQYKKSNDAALNALNILPIWTEPRVNLGKTHFVSGEYKSAINEFQKVIKSDTTKVKGYVKLADINCFLGNLESAEELYNKALQIDPSNLLIKSQLSILKAKEGKIELALKELDNIIRLDTSIYTPFLYRAMISHHNFLIQPSKNHIKARELAEQTLHNYNLAIQKNIKAVDPLVYKSTFYLDLFEHYSKINPKFLKTITNCGKYNPINHINLQVRGNIKKALDLDPYHSMIFVCQARLQYSNNNKKEMKKTIKNCLDTNKNSAKAFYAIGKIYESIGSYSKAEKLYKKCIKRNSKYLPAHISLMRIYSQNNNSGKRSNHIESIKNEFEKNNIIYNNNPVRNSFITFYN